MSKFSKWIEADDLMKRWEIGPLDLIDYVLELKLTAYNRFKIPYNIRYDLMTEEQLSGEMMENNGPGDPYVFVLGNYVFIEDRIGELIFKIEDIRLFEKFFSEDYQSTHDNKEKPLRTSELHKERCRALAGYLWEKYPDTTIEDMIQYDALDKHGCEKKIPPYHKKTLRKWIHDLCPNTKPGRRPKI